MQAPSPFTVIKFRIFGLDKLKTRSYTFDMIKELLNSDRKDYWIYTTQRIYLQRIKDENH